MVVDHVLRDAAISGDEETFLRLLRDGEDVNAVVGQLILGAPSFDELDASFAQASASGRLSILSFLLEKQCLSLYTLNASHSSLKGLTPLGMATYLNLPEFVTVLLEKGDGLVLVDGIDSQRATAVMYAARDGHVDVLRYLIRQGAQICSVDSCHHSVLFYATSVPECLWACELNLRLQRAQSLLCYGKKRKLKLTLQHDISEYTTLACVYQQHTTYPLSSSALHSCVRHLVTSITTSDLSAIQSLLFPTRQNNFESSSSSSVPAPLLVNYPDENGWSAIHYCVTSPRPSTAILDALYLAGADLTLYTGDSTMTPLHALARFGGNGCTTSFRLYAFIVHLVRDLGAPLDAVDLAGETCIHVAARCARCADILMAFLECDTDGSAAKIKNNDGQTAYEVAKLEFRSVFEQDEGSACTRPSSAASLRTIKPSFSSSSLTMSDSSGSSSSSGSADDADETEQHEQFPLPMSREKEDLRAALMNAEEAQKILDRLEYVAERLRKSRSRDGDYKYAFNALKGKAKGPVGAKSTEVLLHYARQTSSELLERYHQLMDLESGDLQTARSVYASLEQLVARLEERALVERQEERASTPPLTNYRRFSTTPSLVASGSSASLTSLADLAALITPIGSPRMGAEVEDLSTPRLKFDNNVAKKTVVEDGETEIDFACALAAGSVTRQRRASALSDAFAFASTIDTTNGADVVLPFPDPTSPLEEGFNLVSISPTCANGVVREPIIQVHESSEGSEGSSDVGTGKRKKAKRESWLDPYVRRANSNTLKEHLANLLEIEEMLFGKEDREREDVPSPGSVADEEENVVGWREGVDHAVLHEVEVYGDEGGNFLDIFGADDDVGEELPMHDGRAEEGYDDGQFLDLFAPSEGDSEDDEFESSSRRASTVKPLHRKSVFTCGRPSALDLLRIARRELYAVEEAMVTACRSIETTQCYISEAERLTSGIFEKMESATQASRLASALSGIGSGGMAVPSPNRSRNRNDSIDSDETYCGRTPIGSPNDQRRTRSKGINVRQGGDSFAFPLPPPSTHAVQPRSLKHFQSMPSLIPLSSTSTSTSSSPVSPPIRTPVVVEPLSVTSEDLANLRQLLIRKVPIWLDATGYDVDKACSWVGIVRAVVLNVRRTRL